MRSIRILLIIVGIIAAIIGFMSYKSNLTNTGSADTALNLTAEEQIYQSFQAMRTGGEESFDALLSVLPDIDWSAYSREYDTDEDNALGAMDLLVLLNNAPWTQQDDNMLKVFQARKGLDGDLTDQYIIIVGNFFRDNEERFVQLLSRLDRPDIEQVCRFVANYSYYHLDPEQVKESTITHFKDKELSDNERFVVDALVEAFDSYITDDSP